MLCTWGLHRQKTVLRCFLSDGNFRLVASHAKNMHVVVPAKVTLSVQVFNRASN